VSVNAGLLLPVTFKGYVSKIKKVKVLLRMIYQIATTNCTYEYYIF